MKIAFISYEYPPDTAVGGIATYVYQIARALQLRGHWVEVFAGSLHRTGVEGEEGINVHRIIGKNNDTFAKEIGKVFAQRHQTVNFDVLEGPEIAACARYAVRQVPNIPLVVKLHTPRFLTEKINFIEPSLLQILRWHFGTLRRGKFLHPYPRWQYDSEADIERLHTLDADEITTPSLALGAELSRLWQLPVERITHLPNPYIPPLELLQIPIETSTRLVTFIGRLEIRKGILDLAAAIPQILRVCPETRFRFIGAPWVSPQPNLDMQQYIEQKLWRYRQALEFTGPVGLSRIPSLLAETDICVFPSRWENFPNVCLEAMAAARGVVGSSAGGMVEMLDNGKVGRLVPPCNPDSIAKAVIELLTNPDLRMRLGKAARDRVLSEYNIDRIGALQEVTYQRAIEHRYRSGARSPISTPTLSLKA